jgi:trehalose synthase
MRHVPIPACSPAVLRPLVGAEGFREMETTLAEARAALEGRAVWHVTASEVGGMAEVLRAILGYLREGGIDVHWAVLGGDDEFFAVAQRLYEGLYGAPSGGPALDGPAEQAYARTIAAGAEELRRVVREGDIAVLHDPPTAGLVGPMKALGAGVIWRCHLGVDRPDDVALRTQGFLIPYVRDADAYVFSRREFAWEGLDESRVRVVHPSINPLSPKNEDLPPQVVSAILDAIGLTADRVDVAPTFTRLDRSPSRVDSPAEVVQDAPIPPSSAVVSQLSGFDRLKDQAGLVECFARPCDDDAVHLVVAGPDPMALPSEPDSEVVWSELRAQVGGLPAEIRRKIHLVALPLHDLDESAAMANAIQRRSSVVVRKSFAEGFGLSLAEAMWKGVPVVATRVGGIQDLISDGETGLLIDDPNDLDGFAERIIRVLGDQALAMRLGAAGRERVRQRYVITRHIRDYARVALEVAAGGGRDEASRPAGER